MIKSVTSLFVKAIYHISWHRDDIQGFLSAHSVLARRYTAELIGEETKTHLTEDPGDRGLLGLLCNLNAVRDLDKKIPKTFLPKVFGT